jgi:protein TonB
MTEVPPRPERSAPGKPTAPAKISSQDLLAGRREVIIQHGADQYRLQLTEASSDAAAAPAAAPASAPAAASAPPSADAVINFQRLLMAQLNRAKRYPPLAQRRRAQGVAYLHFTMDRSGKVLAAQLERSSGLGDLDEEVQALIKRADPLPPFPPEMTQDRLELVVPVQFSLR